MLRAVQIDKERGLDLVRAYERYLSRLDKEPRKFSSLEEYVEYRYENAAVP